MTWRWKVFFDHAEKELSTRLPLEPYPIPEGMREKSAQTGPRAHPTTVVTRSWAVRSPQIRQARAACVEAEPAPQVLNLVISPDPRYDLPFFGADLVTLPGGHLIAIDLQPALKRDAAHTEPVWERLQPIFDRWRAQLPDGGPIPEEAEPYFSNGFLWTRLPLDGSGDLAIEQAVWPAFQEYLELYIDLLLEAKPVDAQRCELLRQGQLRYLDYRSEKDPARGMLSRFYGKEWTEDYIHGFLFDHR